MPDDEEGKLAFDEEASREPLTIDKKSKFDDEDDDIERDFWANVQRDCLDKQQLKGEL